MKRWASVNRAFNSVLHQRGFIAIEDLPSNTVKVRKPEETFTHSLNYCHNSKSISTSLEGASLGCTCMKTLISVNTDCISYWLQSWYTVALEKRVLSIEVFGGWAKNRLYPASDVNVNPSAVFESKKRSGGATMRNMQWNSAHVTKCCNYAGSSVASFLEPALRLCTAHRRPLSIPRFRLEVELCRTFKAANCGFQHASFSEIRASKRRI